MKLSQKKTCEGCRAYSEVNGCELGFNNCGPHDKVLGICSAAPQEPCYKPLNYKEYFEARELIQAKNNVGAGEENKLPSNTSEPSNTNEQAQGCLIVRLAVTEKAAQ